ncbi:unnamed protein product [Calypogeia fissa]
MIEQTDNLNCIPFQELPRFPVGIIKSTEEKGLTMEDLIGPVNNFVCVPLQEVSQSAEAVHSNEWNLRDLAGTDYKFVRVSNVIVPGTKEIEIAKPNAAKVTENGQTDATQTPMQIDTTPGVGSGTNAMTDDWLDEVDWNMWDDMSSWPQQNLQPVNVNPVQAILGATGSLNNCTINIRVGRMDS